MPVERLCLGCRRTFSPSSRYIRRGQGTYCSKSCYCQRPRIPLDERFWPYVLKTETCWLWQGARSKENGYGRFHLNDSTKVAAHRLAYELTYGMILPGLCCLHRCDNPPCVRPDHLFLGTFSDNTRDMYRKKRDGAQTHPERITRLHGEESPVAKLTDSQIQTIRHLYATESLTQRHIAASFGVAQSTICRIITRKGWSHLP